MATGQHGTDTHQRGEEDPGHGEPGGPGAPVSEAGEPVDPHAVDHGHDGPHDHGHHGHDAHGPADDAWVLIPIGVGLVIGIVLLVVFGLGADVAPYT